MRADVYQRVTDQIVAELEKGVRPWLKPWNAEHAAGRITRPLRGNLVPYQGINVIMLWSEAVAKGFTAPIWMTFKQAQELKGTMRKGEHGTPIVFYKQLPEDKKQAAKGKDEDERALSSLPLHRVQRWRYAMASSSSPRR